MYFIDHVMCSEPEFSEGESKLQSFLESIKFLDNPNDAWSSIMSLLYGVNRTFC
jgi:hypothetical protein